MDDTSNIDDFFGEAKAANEGGGSNLKVHKIEEGKENLFRFAPPVKSLKDKGLWYVKSVLHFGYGVPNEEKPDKPLIRPFCCIYHQNYKTKMVEQDCPECSLIDLRKKEIEMVKAKKIAEGLTVEEAEAFVKPMNQFFRTHNTNIKYVVLAKDVNGEWGLLRIGWKLLKQINEINEKYKKDNGGANALDAKGGIWYSLTRSGSGFNDTTYSAAIAQESLGGGRFQYKNGALTGVDAAAIQALPDLSTIDDHARLNYNQIKAIVDSGGDADIVKGVWDSSRRVATPGAAPAPQAAAAPAPAPTPQVAAPAQAAPTPAAQAPVDPTAALQAQLAALQAQIAAAQAAQVAPAPAVAPAAVPAAPVSPPSVQDLMKMDPKEFLKRFPDPSKK